MTRPLVIDDAFKAECRRLREFAERRENWLFLDEDMNPPFIAGQRPEYVMETEFGFRVVFTITHAPAHAALPFRHMSISVPRKGRFPHPVAVITMAHHLGFTGATVEEEIAVKPGPSWAIGVNDEENTAIVQQPLEPDA